MTDITLRLPVCLPSPVHLSLGLLDIAEGGQLGLLDHHLGCLLGRLL